MVFLPNCCSLSEARGKSSCSCSGRGSGKLNHIVMIIHGGTHKLRRQERGGGLPNAYATTKAYVVNLITEGERGSKISKILPT